jgi:hypothetical protein
MRVLQGIRYGRTLAEREGFEPTVLFRYSRFPGVRLKPLSHLSDSNRGKMTEELRVRNIFSSNLRWELKLRCR